MQKLNLKITLKLLGPAIKVIFLFYFEGIKVNLFIFLCKAWYHPLNFFAVQLATQMINRLLHLPIIT